MNVLIRAEVLKKSVAKPPPRNLPSPKASVKTYGKDEYRLNIPGPLGFSLRDDEDAPQRSTAPAPPPVAPGAGGGGGRKPVSVGSSGYTKEEIQVLK